MTTKQLIDQLSKLPPELQDKPILAIESSYKASQKEAIPNEIKEVVEHSQCVVLFYWY